MGCLKVFFFISSRFFFDISGSDFQRQLSNVQKINNQKHWQKKHQKSGVKKITPKANNNNDNTTSKSPQRATNIQRARASLFTFVYFVYRRTRFLIFLGVLGKKVSTTNCIKIGTWIDEFFLKPQMVLYLRNAISSWWWMCQHLFDNWQQKIINSFPVSWPLDFALFPLGIVLHIHRGLIPRQF